MNASLRPMDVMSMLHVPILMEVLVVNVKMDLMEMEHFAMVLNYRLYELYD